VKRLGWLQQCAFLCVLLGGSTNSYGEGLVGGLDGFIDPYTAFVSIPDGAVTTFTSNGGLLLGAALNNSPIGLIGGAFGTSASPPFAAFVSVPGGITTAISFPFTIGQIFDTALNNSPHGLIGGVKLDEFIPYAAIVSVPSGALTEIPLTISAGQILATSLNNTGFGLIGGTEGTSPQLPYAALVSVPGGSITATISFTFSTGAIEGTALNDSPIGLIVGNSTDTMFNSFPFGAFVSVPGGVITQTLSFTFTNGMINGAALNHSATGLIGGVSVEGFDNVPFAAFVSVPDGALTPIPLGTFTLGQISNVALNEAGIGLIGGQIPGSFPTPASPYAALVAPNGALTRLTLTITSGQITCTALNDPASPPPPTPPILVSIVPKSFGPFSSYANSLFALTHVLECHYMTNHKESSTDPSESISYLTSSRGDTRLHQYSPYCCCKQETYSLWGGAFGELVHQKRRGKIPAFTDEMAGAIVALDYMGVRDFVIGGGFAYVFDYVHYGEGIGHANIDEEVGVFYGSYIRPHFFLNAALWGGGFQLDQERHSIESITSKTNANGWLLSPHLELSSPFDAEPWFVIDPFVLFDWANFWQSQLQEHGKSGMNIVLNNQYSSLLRSEVGLRFHEILRYRWGCLNFEEKASYVNRAPFHTGSGAAFFVGAISSFAIETYSPHVQNLGAVQLNLQWNSYNPKAVYGSLDYQGEFGPSFQSHMLVGEVGRDF
jgi:hypothetical protein